MSGPKTERCWTCHADIYWAINDTTGTPVPVDVEPVANGNMLLSLSPHERRVKQKTPGKFVRVAPGVLVAHIVRKGEEVPDDRNRYVSHFVTCGQSKEWRGRKRGRDGPR
jgi:hypothetical protein